MNPRILALNGLLLLAALAPTAGCTNKPSTDDSSADDSSTDDSSADDSSADDSSADDSDTPVNNAPTAPVVEINPSNPFADDGLQCTITTASTDADGDTIQYSYSWTRDGADAGVSTDSVAASATQAGEQWSCTVTPNDGHEDGPSASASTEIERCSGLNFDGMDDRVEMGNIDWDTFTIEAWIRSDDTVGFHSVVSDINNSNGHYYNNVELAVNEGALLFTMGGGSGWQALTSSQAVVAGEWTHIAAMYDGDTMSLAVNGVADNSTSGVVLSQEDTPLFIGARPVNLSGEDFFFNGTIDSVRISRGVRYSGSFSPDEALRVDGSTQAAWSFNEGSGMLAGDDAGNLDGTLQGATWSSGCDAVANGAPTAPVVSVSPDEPNQTDELVCSVDTPSTDPDGDAVSYRYDWYVDGGYSGISGDTLPADSTAPDEQWTCVVTPNDGAYDGPSARATVDIGSCYALDFDGSTQYVNALSDIEWGSFTIEAWVYPDALDHLSAIVSDINNSAGHYYKNVELAVSTNGSLSFTMGAGSGWSFLNSTATVPVGAWTHVAATYDNGTMAVYINGVADNTATSSLSQESGQLYIGARPGNLDVTDFFWDGRIDSVRISDGVRYASGFTPPTTMTADSSTLGLWSFDEGSGTVATNDAGDDGSIEGATWVEECTDY